jgi:hypothetical protein
MCIRATQTYEGMVYIVDSRYSAPHWFVGMFSLVHRGRAKLIARSALEVAVWNRMPLCSLVRSCSRTLCLPSANSKRRVMGAS